jgi:hypothetical protein
MIENNQFEEALVGANTQRSATYKNVGIGDITYIEDHSTVYFTYRNNDQTFVIGAQSEISPTGEFGLKLSSM